VRQQTKPIYRTIMKMMHLYRCFGIAFTLAAAGQTLAQTTAFTYQGRLNDGASPANGLYDFEASLQDSGSNTVAGPLVVSATVSNGLFSLALDFGATQLTGEDRWLQLAVRTNGAGSFTPIFPPQQLTSTPYAVRAANAAAAVTAGSVAATNITGAIGLAQLPATLVTNGADFVGTFNGDGLSLASLNVASLRRFGSSSVVAWGYSVHGETNVPPGLSNVIAVAAGTEHSVALKSNGTIVAWGDDTYFQTDIPAGLTDVVAIAVGSIHNLALKSDGTVAVWGYNVYRDMNIPAGLSNVQAVAAGQFHSLALKSDGTVVGWGNNGDGQASIPAGLSNVLAIAAGANHSLALRSDGLVVAWGNNNFFQTNVPVGLSNVVAISGGGTHSLALKSDGTVAAWGDNSYSQTTIPAGLNNVVSIAAGGEHSLALRSDGTVTGWGLDNIGQATIPAGVRNVAAITAGSLHSLAIQKVSVPAQVALLTDNNAFQGALTAASFTGNGSGLTSLNASQLASGTVPDARLSANVPLLTGGILSDSVLSTNVALRSTGNIFTGNQFVSDGTVGTPVAADLLHVAGAGGTRARVESTGASYSGFLAKNSQAEWFAGVDPAAGVGTWEVVRNFSLGASRFVITTNGNMGMGTLTPQKQLQVGDSSTPGREGMIHLASRSASGLAARDWQIGVPQTTNDLSGVGYSFIVHDVGMGTGDPAQLMVQYGTGNVGIGTNAPQQRLHVVGNILATGTITGSSDRNVKEKFQPVDAAAILSRVAALPIQRWNYIGETTPHIGPMAQDFYAAFSVGLDDKHISMVDADGVALAAIQRLNQKLVEELKQRDAENAGLKARLERLEKFLNDKVDGGAE
jgi:hypothetical protein